MSPHKVLVTGGAGFIGGHVAAALDDAGHEVVVLDSYAAGGRLPPGLHGRVTVIEGDVRDAGLVRRAAEGCATIVHLAAVVGVEEVIRRPLDMLETETVGTQNVVDAALEHSVGKILFASSSAVYDKATDGPSRETDRLHPKSSYAVAKQLNEHLMDAVARETDVATNSLRFFNVYGERQDCRMVIPRFFRAAMDGAPLEVFGDGSETRDYTHVSDVARAVRALVDRRHLSGAYNVARGIETDILTLAEAIRAVTGAEAPVLLRPFPAERHSFQVHRRVGDNEKLFRDTGVRPTVLLAEGLAAYYRYRQRELAVGVAAV